MSGERKLRAIFAPNPAMKKIHLELKALIDQINIPYAVGCVKGWSPVKNANVHKNNTYFYLLDIHHAYPNVESQRLHRLLKKYQFQDFNFKYFYGKNGLYTGGNASPGLFNLYSMEYLDNILGEYCKKHNITYTRYLDDLTFSSLRPIGKRKRKFIRDTINQAGLPISYRKARVLTLNKGAITINGIGINTNHELFIPKHYRKIIINTIKNACTDPNPKNQAQAYGRLGSYIHLKKITGYNSSGLERYEETLKGVCTLK